MADYIPTDWVDNVTPASAANLNKLEGGVQAAQAAADAATAAVASKADLSIDPADTSGLPNGTLIAYTT